MDIQFGSFARNTKIRELDDIDYILVFSAEGSTYWQSGFGEISLQVPETAADLRRYCDDGWLNSRKLINKLVSSLSAVYKGRGPSQAGSCYVRNAKLHMDL